MSSRAIDHLRAILDHLDGERREHQLEFFRSVLAAGPGAVVELDAAPAIEAAKAPKRKAAAKHDEAVAEMNHAIEAAAEPKKAAPKGRKKVAVAV